MKFCSIIFNTNNNNNNNNTRNNNNNVIIIIIIFISLTRYLAVEKIEPVFVHRRTPSVFVVFIHRSKVLHCPFRRMPVAKCEVG